MTSIIYSRCLYIAAMTCMVGLAALVGCSNSSQQSQVSGTVKLDGTSIGPGLIVFTPVGDGKPATGSIESDGSYTLMTSRDPGLRAGTYKVMVSIREMPQNMKPGDRPPPGKLLIPEKYEDISKSGLEYDVAPGSNTIDIELKSRTSNAAVNRTSSRLSQTGFSASFAGVGVLQRHRRYNSVNELA